MEFNQIGGRIRHFLPFWYTICKDRVVLDMLKAVKVPFINNTPPTQSTLLCELKMSVEEQNFMQAELQQLLVHRFIRKLDKMIPNGWVSNIFLVPKKDGGFRMILSLKELNKHVVYTKFKMDGIEKVIEMLRPMDYCSSLDISRAYGHLYIFLEHQKILSVLMERPVLLLLYTSPRFLRLPSHICQMYCTHYGKITRDVSAHTHIH